MAELPDSNILGSLPQPGSRRPVSTIDVSGYARGAAAIGSGVETLGKGITSAANDVAAVIKQERAADQKLQLARAQSSLNAAIINHGNAIDSATDPANLEQNARISFDEAVRTAAASIESPYDRELFVLGAQPHGARLAGAASQKAFALARDAGKARDREVIRKQTDDALKSSDPNAVNLAVHSVRAIVDGWAGNGWSTPAEAAWEQTSYAQDFAARKIAALSFAEQVEVLRGGPAQDGTAAAQYRPLADLLPTETRERMRIKAERQYAQASYETFDATERTLNDAANGLVPLPARKSIEQNPNLRPSERSRALAAYDRAAGEVGKLKGFQTRLLDTNAVFDSSDQETRDLADRHFISRGGTNEALREIVQRTGILPASAATAFKRSLASGTADSVMQTMQTLGTLPPQAFVNLADAPALTEALDTYRAKVLTGKPAAEAAREYVEEKNQDARMPPELRKAKEEELQRVSGRVSYEKMRDALQMAEWRAWGPFAAAEAGVSNADRIRVLHDFRQVVKEIYLSQHSTDIDEAINKAAIRFGRSYGVSTMYGPDPTDLKQAWGTPRLVRFAPASWPGYAAAGIKEKPEVIEGLIKRVAADTVEGKMEDPSGWRVDPNSIVLRPLNYERTEASFTQAGSAKPPEYLLSYQDKFGLIQTVGTVAITPDELREAQWKIARPAFEAGQRKAMAADDARIKSTADRWLSPANRERKRQLIAEEQKVLQDVLDEESRNVPGLADIFPGRPAGRLGPARP